MDVIMLFMISVDQRVMITAFFLTFAFSLSLALNPSENMPSSRPNPLEIVPDNGPESGGTDVVITGEHFGTSADELVNVMIVGEEMLDIKWINASFISGQTPPKRDGGKGAVVVTTKKGGQSHDELKFTYNYRPKITSFDPTSGPIAGGTWVNISGRYFGEARDDIVKLALAGIPCAQLRWINGKNIICLSGENTAGQSISGPITITTFSGGEGTSENDTDVRPIGQTVSWTYNPTPLTTRIMPENGPAYGGTSIEIYGESLGQSLDDILDILVSGRPCDAISFISPNHLKCITPPISPDYRNIPPLDQREGPPPPLISPVGSVVVRTKSGGDGDKYHSVPFPRFNARFEFNRPPYVFEIFPPSGLSSHAISLSISGTNLGRDEMDVLDIQIGNASCRPSLTFESSYRVHCQSPILESSQQSGISVRTVSGGWGYYSVKYTSNVDCRLFSSPTQCARKSCFWCAATTRCLDDEQGCPATCLLRGSHESCTDVEGCEWCHATGTCMTSLETCPVGCFRYLSMKTCSKAFENINGTQCVWCHTTGSCLQTDWSVQYHEAKEHGLPLPPPPPASPSSDVSVSSCPHSCSLSFGSHLTCGSAILTILLCLLLLTICFGIWVIVYFIKRDAAWVERTRRWALRMNSPPLTTTQSPNGALNAPPSIYSDERKTGNRKKEIFPGLNKDHDDEEDANETLPLIRQHAPPGPIGHDLFEAAAEQRLSETVVDEEYQTNIITTDGTSTTILHQHRRSRSSISIDSPNSVILRHAPNAPQQPYTTLLSLIQDQHQNHQQ